MSNTLRQLLDAFDPDLPLERARTIPSRWYGDPDLAVAVWGPLVWVHGGKQPPPLETYLAPLAARTGPHGLDPLRFVERREYVMGCNWKVFVDNYLDGGYHINSVHPGLAGITNYK